MNELQTEWLTLTEASRLLGVHPITLRAWVDAGLVRAFRTPGGHRRLLVTELREFLDQRRAGNQAHALVATPDQTLEQVRSHLNVESMRRSSWYLRLSESQRAKHRDMGQRLLGLLLQFVSRGEKAEHFLVEGKGLAQEYGRELAGANLSAAELARAFLFFRRTIVNAAYHPEGTEAQVDAEGLRLLHRINTFMDELLIATLDGYDQMSRRVAGKYGSPLPARGHKTPRRLQKRTKR